jgi:hypothetical protein
VAPPRLLAPLMLSMHSFRVMRTKDIEGVASRV